MNTRIVEATDADREGFYNPADLLRVIKCDCSNRLFVTRHNAWSLDCRDCGREYNGSGQLLRSDWRDNESNYDDDVSDLDGYEMAHADF